MVLQLIISDSKCGQAIYNVEEILYFTVRVRARLEVAGLVPVAPKTGKGRGAWRWTFGTVSKAAASLLVRACLLGIPRTLK